MVHSLTGTAYKSEQILEFSIGFFQVFQNISRNLKNLLDFSKKLQGHLLHYLTGTAYKRDKHFRIPIGFFQIFYALCISSSDWNKKSQENLITNLQVHSLTGILEFPIGVKLGYNLQ